MTIIRMQDLELAGKRVLIREDLNVPVKDGVVTSDARIRAALPTIKQALAAGARVMVMSHLGRPKGKIVPALSLRPVADRLAELVGAPVRFATDSSTPSSPWRPWWAIWRSCWAGRCPWCVTGWTAWM